jgi:hypothetical protein
MEVYQGPWAPEDKDANFKEEVAHYSRIDPMTTLDRMSHNLGIPVGALARYVLVKWAASGSEGLMEIGPRVVRQMEGMVNKAEAAGTSDARLEAYHSLARIISWLKVPLDSPQRPIADRPSGQGKG